jgi:catechol 2,3-dioxygenase-like lactoylglutathione lyase family enzyme
MFRGLDHVTLVVAALEPALKSYQTLLGIPPSWRGAHPALGSEAAIFALANSAVELLAPLPEAAEAEGLRSLLAQQGEGLLSLTFGVEDAEAAQRELRARGLRVAPPESGEAVAADGNRRSYRTIELSRRSSRGIPLFGVERARLGELRARAPVPSDCVDALDHVALRSSAPDAVAKLYGADLGLRLALDRPLGSLRMLFFRSEGVTIEFVEDPSAGADDRFYGLAFRVKDIGAAHARLERSGLSVSELRAGHKPGTEVFTVRNGSHGVPTLILRDPARD